MKTEKLWVRLAAGMAEIRNAYKILVGKSDEKRACCHVVNGNI
jgi:hypothetical protein